MKECNCSLCTEIKSDFGAGPEATPKVGPEATPKGTQTKPPVADMLSDFHLALLEVARVTEFGCTKHGKLGGWRSVPNFRSTYQNKKARHALEGLMCDVDEESGLNPLAHEAWNALALLQDKLERGTD